MPKIKVDLKIKQFAALPYRITEGGMVEFLVVTSRDTEQWIFTKGKHEHGKTPSEIAAMEAEEEAGVKGEVATEPVGGFLYDKTVRRGPKRREVKTIRCTIEVYLLRVTAQLEDWKEKGQRKVEWVTLDEALRRLSNNKNIPNKKKLQNKEKLHRLFKEIGEIFSPEKIEMRFRGLSEHNLLISVVPS